MIMRDESSSYEAGEPWMALPLFNRKASPDHTKGSMAWYGCWPSSDEDNDMADYQSYEYYDDNTPTSAMSSKSQSVSLASDVQMENGADCFFHDHGPIEHPGLLDEISDEHIPQPSFASHTTCPFPECKSTAIFTTGRDFRRHYRQHFKRFFCRYEECPQSVSDLSEAGNKGFATRKDRTRHEAKHNPAIQCKWRSPSGEQCSRTFSRMDNMRDHYRRIHNK